jgi:RecB family exonuclease
MGALLKVSASQVETFLRCPRAWYNGSILGDREPQKPHQKRGEDVHAELEHYGKTGEVRPSEYLEIVQVALDHLGEHRHVKDPYWSQFNGDAGLLLEQEILMPTYEGGPSWIGYIDRVVALPDKGEVWDYKTTSDFRYAKTPEELLENIQMQSYAHWLFMNSDYSECLVKHLCLRMRGRAAAKPVEAVTTRERTEAFWQGKILPLVRQMAEWAKLRPVTAEPLPPHTDHCNDYGGCFYRTKCGFTTLGTRSFNKMAENDLLKQMLAQAGAVGVATTAPTSAAPITPAPTSAPAMTSEALLASLQAPTQPAAQAQATAPAPTTASAALAPASTSPASTSPAPAPAGAMDLTALLGMAAAPAATEPPVKVTPDTFPLATTHATPATTSPILPPDATSRVSTPEEVGPAPTTVPVEPTPEAAPATTGAPKAKRGRPKKSDAAPEAPAVLPGQQALPGTDPAPAPVVTAAPATPAPADPVAAVDLAALAPAAPAVPAAPALTATTQTLMTADSVFPCGVEVLFVDSFPQKGWPDSDKPYHLDDFMHTFTRLAASSAKQADYALIAYQAKGYLRTAIRILMHALPKVVVVNTATAGAAEFLEVVTPYAKLIVRGTR